MTDPLNHLPEQATLSAVRFGPAARDLLLTFAHGPRLALPASLLPPLRRLSTDQLAGLEVAEDGRAVTWPALGLVLPVATLVPLLFGLSAQDTGASEPGGLGLEGAGPVPGTPAPEPWTERDLVRAWARAAGSRRSEAKAEAARRNGRKGGRPRKPVG
ncbi:MAG: DUF2442 domain-containing protein [Candidatus Sericytochromatia bacterium]|nr:DUF2442 domain-containing protein [Candidatus Sericytochromatia bacterium]